MFSFAPTTTRGVVKHVHLPFCLLCHLINCWSESNQIFEWLAYTSILPPPTKGPLGWVHLPICLLCYLSKTAGPNPIKFVEYMLLAFTCGACNGSLYLPTLSPRGPGEGLKSVQIPVYYLLINRSTKCNKIC